MRLPLPPSFATLPAAAAPSRAAACPLIEPLSLSLPRLPDELVDFTLLHVSDLHARRPRRRFEQLVQAVAETEVDLLLLTGDFMSKPGDEAAAEKLLRDLLAAARTRRGVYAVWGNHDSAELRRRCADLPLRWLNNDAVALDDLPLSVLGVDCGEDECRRSEGCLQTAMRAMSESHHNHFRLLLAHVPSWLTEAAEAKMGLVLSGHTHGGQIRLPWIGPLFNATPGWPLHLSSGLLRQRDTFAVVSRGMGESYVDGLRLLCRPHVPLVTLKQGGEGEASVVEPSCVRWW